MSNFQTRYDTLANGSTVYYSDTIPSALGAGITAKVGDYCVNANFATSGADCVWVCTVAGSPGTWVVCARGVQDMIFGPLGSTSSSCAIPLPGGTWQVASVAAVASAASSSGTLQVEYLTGTTAPGSGTVQLTGTIALGSTYTANTVVNGTVISAPTAMVGGTGRIGVVLAGTLTSLANLYVKVSLQKIS